MSKVEPLQPQDSTLVYADDRVAVRQTAPAHVEVTSPPATPALMTSSLQSSPAVHAPPTESPHAKIELRQSEKTPLVGLALSGGGIRSATFSLGVLQRLASLKHLQKIDYLSTVSGGGYVGSWLSAWIKHSSLAQVEIELSRTPESNQIEPTQVQWLRRYSNYLTPRVGAMSLDALTVAATYLRNVLLNLTVLVSSFIVALLIPILLVGVMQYCLANPDVSARLAGACALVALVFTSIQLALCSTQSRSKWTEAPVAYVCVILPVFLAALFGSAWLKTATLVPGEWTISAGIGIVAVLIATFGVSAWLIKQPKKKTPTIPDTGHAGPLLYAGATVVVLPLAYLALWTLHTVYAATNLPATPVMLDATLVTRVLAFGPLLLVTIGGLAVTLWIGLMGRAYREMYREWWSRIGGAVIAVSVGWTAWCFLAIDVPVHLGEWLTTLNLGIGKMLAAGWLGSLGGAIAMLQRASGSTKSTKSLSKPASIAAVLATVFVIGLMVAIAIGTHALLHALTPQPSSAGGIAEILAWISRATPASAPETMTAVSLATHLAPAWSLLIIASLVALLLGWRVDINRFSLHDMYKNRLIRCYLGASNPNRNPNRFTGFDPADDMALSDLATVGPLDTTNAADATVTAAPQRPFHIFNTTLNLTHGSELAWQERKAAGFVLTPTYSGFNLSPASGDKHLIRPDATPGVPNIREQAFRPTKLYADDAPSSVAAHYTAEGNKPKMTDNGNRVGFTVGMAMATSGAAVSPNMGANSQPALAFLMTVFNIRLGRWSPNPAKKHWRRASPRSNLAWLLAEVTGNTSEQSAFVYLSDGGHFENTGVYELVRRRCSHIVMVDAGADPERSFEDLGNLIRKCRVDLGAEIKLSLEGLYALKSGRSTSASVLGEITYDTADPNGRRFGKILLLKPTLGKAREEPADIYNYGEDNATFPQQTTLDQWFDESQFESYRFLGTSIAGAAFNQHKLFFNLAHPDSTGLNNL